MIESVENLRKLCQGYRDKLLTIRPFTILQMLVAIEAEIAERYIELPVDANGVPIRLGDKVWVKWAEEELEVIAFTSEDLILAPELYVHPSEVTHVKPRTVEDVLRDFLKRTHGVDEKQRYDALVIEHAAELRKMIGGNDG